MNDRAELIAWLLAGEEHPHLRTEAEYLHAEEVLHSSEDLRREYEEALAFSNRHPRLLGFGVLPPDVRMRIAFNLREAVRQAESPLLRPWSVRRQFAWAAVLALFLAGMSVVTTAWLEQNQTGRQGAVSAHPLPSPRRMDDFYAFASRVTRERPPLQHESAQMLQLVSWLGDHAGAAPELSPTLLDLQGMGCSVMEGPHGSVSVVCVDVAGNRFNLFVGCAKALRREPASARRFRLENREVMEWVDENNTFLLVPEDPDVSMPEILL